MLNEKTYLGDAVYAQIDSSDPFTDRLILTTENGVSVSNAITLEPVVWAALLIFLEKRYPATSFDLRKKTKAGKLL